MVVGLSDLEISWVYKVRDIFREVVFEFRNRVNVFFGIDCGM